MRRAKTVAACVALAMVLTWSARAQERVVENRQHEEMLSSKDPTLARHKRLVYDFWREVLEAGHLDLAEKYLTERYIQHNPSVPTGRKGFVEFFAKLRQPIPIEPRVKTPIVAIVAEGDLVVISFVRELPEPGNPSKKYTSTSFDMFRIENNRIVEHWDSALKQ
jgi:predicted SnoaL-like aldol condensation-catalyzing enzyme